MRKITFVTVIVVCVMLFLAGTVKAHNPDYTIPSPGVPGAAITINGVEGGGEWMGSHMFSIVDYGGGDPLSATVKALHKADGIYLLMVIADNTDDNTDSVRIRFDINHNATPAEASDWGIEVRRDNQATWGAANVDPATWSSIPEPPQIVEATRTPTHWTVEIHLPTGMPSNLDLSTGTVGIHFILFNAGIFSGASAIYTQWPQPPAADLNALLDDEPNVWGDYIFDPATTFPNIAVTDVRNNYGGSENYRKISRTLENKFEVRVTNPGGTVITDADNVRINLYLSARGIGEPFHRLDEGALINQDCSSGFAPCPAPSNFSDACTPACTTSEVDVSTINLLDPAQKAALLGGTARYTIKDGVTRMGTMGPNHFRTITPADSGTFLSVVNWTLISGQKPKFDVIDGQNRGHQCMKAEAIVPNDPSTSDNFAQVNMDFVCVPGFMISKFLFSLGWAGFGKYDPNIGKEMFLQVVRTNMEEDGWKYQLEGVERLGEDSFVAKLRGEQSLSLQLGIAAPSQNALGKPLKENLMVPPDAGGRHKNVRRPSGGPPVYVKVEPGSDILVANYSFHEGDEQFVDTDGQNETLPPNGPDGLPPSFSEKACRESEPLAPHISTGAMIGSFDNFRTAFLVGDGVLARVPREATHLALGINDCVGVYEDNAGTGFRVKVAQRLEREGTFGMIENSFIAQAMAAEPAKVQIRPISEVMPTLCINGYENIEEKRTVGGTPHELYRYIGNVCWGIINVFSRERTERLDESDRFEEDEPEPTPPEPNPGACGLANGPSYALLFTGLAAAVIGRRLRRRMR